jgi:nitrate/TMAO reductase-like tetraheme cytochrome c subunit
MSRNRIAYIFNVISIAGILMAAVATFLIVGFLALELMTGHENPYVGILTFFIFPGMLICGLLLIPLGMWRIREKMRAEGATEIPPMPRLDLNDPVNFRSLIFFCLATMVFVVIVAISTIKGYEFTESTAFCGELCHIPMEPEHTAWQHSPHAQVKCVECHVGPGAQWYVKAKISGMRQLYAVIAKSYPTPIHTPIPNLRPAKDTCLECHWPEKFYFGRQKVFYHYAPNEQNTPREIDMLLKIGVTPKSDADKGIHGHILKDIVYVARDFQRQDIPYVAVREKDGTLLEYVTSDKPLSKEEMAKGEQRTMDCIDCHNRPTHIYRSPSLEMDMNLAAGRIDSSLPYIKKVAVEILAKPFNTKEEAFAAIQSGLTGYYAKNYPAVASSKPAALKQAVDEIQKIYGRNFFPRMKVAWNTYPDNIGHFNFPGCFRCHDGKHKAKDGKVISKDCNLCHVLIGQKMERVPAGTKSETFIHPADIGEELYRSNCTDCHQAPPPPWGDPHKKEHAAAH